MAQRSGNYNLSTETLFALGGFVVGALVTGAVAFFISGTESGPTPHGLRESDITGTDQYKFIDPLIGVSSTQTNAPQYAALQQSITDYIATYQKNGLTAASVRFSDIRAAEGFTVYPDEIYNPSSLNKVPVMLAYFKLAEADPAILSVHLTYTGQPDLDAHENIPSPTQLSVGASYSTLELIERMIKYSDNNAVALLSGYLYDSGRIGALYAALGDLGVPEGKDRDYLKVDSYVMFFRALYNATYLNASYSEQALSILAGSDFTQGIAASVPANIEVAHKYGDNNLVDTNNELVGRQLHDCGIVYYPYHPYMLCVMTKGGVDITVLESVIAGISQLVYKDMQQRYPTAAN